VVDVDVVVAESSFPPQAARASASVAKYTNSGLRIEVISPSWWPLTFDLVLPTL